MSTNDDITANDIPDILAGTTGTEASAFQNDQAAVMAALQQDPNLLAEVQQPGFVEVVNELAGDAAPTLGAVETVGESYQDANGESMGDAFTDLLQNQPGSDLNPQPLPPSPTDELQQIEQQLEALEGQINPQPTQEFSSFGAQEEQTNPFESAQAEPGFAAEPGAMEPGAMEPGAMEPSYSEQPSYEDGGGGFNPSEYET
jgi:hypothetical protein